MRRILAPAVLVLALVLAPAGCGGKQESTSPTAKQDDAPEAEQSEVSGKGKQWGGWRWKGKREDCFFVVGNVCYSELATACKAAKCGADDCRTEGGGPAQVSCVE